MRAVVLSAGRGSRLLPLTRSVPKCLVGVDGRAILDHQLGALAAAGVGRATVVGGYRFAQLAEHLARAGPPLEVELVLNPFWAVASSIGSVWAARHLLDEPFLLLNGDTLFEPSLLRAAIGGGEGVTLLVEPLGRPQPDDMLARVANGRVLDVRKDLDPDRATHRSLGAVASTGGSDYALALEAVIGAEGGEQAFHHAVVARLAATVGVRAAEAPAGSRWQEIDRPDDIVAWSRERADRARGNA